MVESTGELTKRRKGSITQVGTTLASISGKEPQKGGIKNYPLKEKREHNTIRSRKKGVDEIGGRKEKKKVSLSYEGEGKRVGGKKKGGKLKTNVGSVRGRLRCNFPMKRGEIIVSKKMCQLHHLWGKTAQSKLRGGEGRRKKEHLLVGGKKDHVGPLLYNGKEGGGKFCGTSKNIYRGSKEEGKQDCLRKRTWEKKHRRGWKRRGRRRGNLEAMQCQAGTGLGNLATGKTSDRRRATKDPKNEGRTLAGKKVE